MKKNILTKIGLISMLLFFLAGSVLAGPVDERIKANIIDADANDPRLAAELRAYLSRIVYEGESKTVTVDGHDYEITVNNVDWQPYNAVASISVNGIEAEGPDSRGLKPGDVYGFKFDHGYVILKVESVARDEYKKHFIEFKLEPTENRLKKAKCIDSDDGKDYNTKGRIELHIVEDVSIMPYTDSCSGGVNLYEFVCDHAVLNPEIDYCKRGCNYYVIHTCPYGCINGACVAENELGDYDAKYGIRSERSRVTYNVNGKGYEIEHILIDSSQVEFRLNKESAGNLEKGQSHTFSDGSIIEVADIFKNKYNRYEIHFYFKAGTGIMATPETATLPISQGSDLSEFSNMIGDFIGVVIGDTAPPYDVISAGDIFIELGIPTKLVSEIDDPLKQDLISIGNPCNNDISAELMGNPSYCLSGFKEGEAIIRSYGYNGKMQILVAGYSDADTRKAANVLANWEDYSLKGTEMKITSSSTGSIVVQEIITVVDEQVSVEEEQGTITEQEPVEPFVEEEEEEIRIKEELPIEEEIVAVVVEEEEQVIITEEEPVIEEEIIVEEKTVSEEPRVEESEETTGFIEAILNFFGSIFG